MELNYRNIIKVGLLVSASVLMLFGTIG